MTTSSSATGKTRTQRAFLALFSSVAFLVLGTLISFVASPILVRALGTERFGVSRALLDAFAYIILLEFGLAGASRPVIVAAVGTGDPVVVAHTVRTMLRSFLVPMLLKVGGALLIVALFTRLFNVPPQLRHEATTAAALMVLVVFATASPVFQNLLSAQQREYRNVLVQGTQNLTLISLSVAAAVLGYGLVGQAAVFVATTLLASLALFAFTHRYLKIDGPRPDLADHARSQLRRLNWWVFLRSICGRVALNSDRLFIAGLLSAVVVTRFHISVRLVDVAAPFLFAIGNSSWPALADIKLRGDHGLFDARLREVSALIVIIGILLMAPVVVVSAPFVERWMGAGFFLGHAVICLAALNGLLLALLSFWDQCLASVGDPRTLLRPSIVAAIVNVGVTVVATRLRGPTGPLLGTTMAMGGISFAWTVRLLADQLRVAPGPLLKSLARPFGAGLLYVAAGLIVLSPHCRATWPSISLTAFGTALGWALLAWTLLMNDEMRGQTRARLAHIVAKVKRPPG